MVRQLCRAPRSRGEPIRFFPQRTINFIPAQAAARTPRGSLHGLFIITGSPPGQGGTSNRPLPGSKRSAISAVARVYLPRTNFIWNALPCYDAARPEGSLTTPDPLGPPIPPSVAIPPLVIRKRRWYVPAEGNL